MPLGINLALWQAALQGGGGPILCTPAYVTGDRTASIAVTASDGLVAGAFGSVTNIVNGSIVTNSTGSCALNAVSASGHWLQFDFVTPTYITEATFYEHIPSVHGTWKWQGSSNGTDWVDIGSGFTLGAIAIQVQTQLSGNDTYYRYYRLLGVSGTTSTAPWIQEIEFKQCTSPP